MKLKLFLSLSLAIALCFHGCTKTEIEELVIPETPSEELNPDESAELDDTPDDVTDEDGDDEFFNEPGDGTRENPYTIPQAVDLIHSDELKPHKGYYVKGLYEETIFSDYSAGWISYYISQHGNTNELFVTKCYGLGGERITDRNYLSKGDRLVVYGKLSFSNSRNEMSDSHLCYLNGVTAEVEEFEYVPEEGVYYNDFDKETLSAIGDQCLAGDLYITSSPDCWKNEIGSGADRVDYNFSGDTSVYFQGGCYGSGYPDYSKYDGSNWNFICLGGGDEPNPLKNYFVVKNISLPSSVTDYTLYFGAKRGVYSSSGAFSQDDLNVYISDDGNRWVELSYEFQNGDPAEVRWDLASTTFSLPSQTPNLYIYFTTHLANGYCIDDVCLMASNTKGASVNFSTGIELPGYTVYEGDGTQASPYKVSQAYELANSGEYDSDKIYFVKGLVGQRMRGLRDDGTMFYEISESGYGGWDNGVSSEPSFYIGDGYLGGEKFTDSNILQAYDEVVIYGKLSEMDEARVYSINGTVMDFGTEGDGTKENPYTVADGLKILRSNLLGTEIYPDEVYYVKGIVSKIVSREDYYDKVLYTRHIKYNISDDGSDNDEFCISMGYDFCHTPWFGNSLYASDEVIVYGNLSGSGMGTGNLYYQNGEKEDEDNVCYYMTDSHFKSYCLYSFDTDGNGKVSFAEADEVTTIKFSFSGMNKIYYDFTGTEYFPNLESFESTSAKYLDVSKNAELSYIYLAYSNISTMDLSSNMKILSLDDESFYECENLKSITFPESLRSIGSNAFRSCTSLETLSFPENLSSIGNYVFSGCTSLESVSFSEGLKEIGNSMFFGCTSLESVSFPESLETIGDEAFRSCTSLETLSFPENLSSIRSSAFAGCTSLESVSFPESLETIGDEAFRSCTSLETLSFPENLSSIGSSAFSGCTSLESVSFPEGLEKIESRTFYQCTSLEALSFPENLSSIGAYAFSGCTSLESVSFSEGLETIGHNAFRSCTSLETLSFPENLSSIGGYAFENCSNLKSASIKATTPPSLEEDCFANIDSSAVLYVPSGCQSAYKNSTWSEYFQILTL